MTMQTCQNCNGTGIIKIGYVWNGVFFQTAERECSECDGTGKIEMEERIPV